MDKDEIRKRFVANLLRLRKLANLTQTELAEKAEVSQSAVKHYETGNADPSWTNAVLLASALGVLVTSFLDKPTQDEEKPKRARRKDA